MAVAVIPAAGTGSRLGDATPGSKEVAEVGGRPVVEHVLDRLAIAGIERGVVVIRPGKDDISSAISGDDRVGVEFLVLDESPSELYSVAAGTTRISGPVVLAYPDVLFEPVDGLSALLHRLDSTGADLVLGLFPTDTPDRVDMVALDDRDRPVQIVIKQPDRGLRYSWAIAAWSPRFSEFLLLHAGKQRDQTGEPTVGDAAQAAIEAGFAVEAVRFDCGTFIDIGTPHGLATARRWAGG
jgi:glucose-1-phosphate thymidylyltransferase